MLFVDSMLDRNSFSLFLINLFLDTSKFVTAFVSIINNVEWVQYCAKVMQTIIDEYRDVSAIFNEILP